MSGSDVSGAGAPNINPLAPEHLPGYIVAADGSDSLFTIMTVFAVLLILGIGILYLNLHAMPEKMAHKSNHTQMQVVGILALLALFTHNNLFWVIALLVAAFRPPDFMTPLTSIATSLATIAKDKGAALVSAPPSPPDQPDVPSGEAVEKGGMRDA